LIKNSQPFGKKFQKTAEGDFFDSHCTAVSFSSFFATQQQFQQRIDSFGRM